MSATPLPTKPITRAFIVVKGDPTAGIPHARFEATLFLDPSCFSPEDWPLVVSDARRSLEKCYRGIHGDEPTTVAFDFERTEPAQYELEDQSQ